MWVYILFFTYRLHLNFHTGWLVFDITEAVKIWQRDFRTNNGILLTVTEANNARHQQIHPSLVGLSHINKAKPNQEVRNFILSKIEQLPIL